MPGRAAPEGENRTRDQFAGNENRARCGLQVGSTPFTLSCWPAKLTAYFKITLAELPPLLFVATKLRSVRHSGEVGWGRAHNLSDAKPRFNYRLKQKAPLLRKEKVRGRLTENVMRLTDIKSWRTLSIKLVRTVSEIALKSILYILVCHYSFVWCTDVLTVKTNWKQLQNVTTFFSGLCSGTDNAVVIVHGGCDQYGCKSGPFNLEQKLLLLLFS